MQSSASQPRSAGEHQPFPVRLHLQHLLQLRDSISRRSGSQNELGVFLCRDQRREQAFHRDRADLALRHLHLPDPGAGGGGGERVGRREGAFHLQHAAARLQQRLLRPLLPRLPHPPVGPAAHHRLHPRPAGGHAHRPSPPHRQEAVSPGGPHQPQRPGADQGPEDEDHRRPLVDLHHQPAVPRAVRVRLHVPLLRHLPRVQDVPPGEVRLVSLSQRGGLLRVPSHRENGLHGLHAGGVGGLHPPQHRRDPVSGGEGREPPSSPLQGLGGGSLDHSQTLLFLKNEKKRSTSISMGAFNDGVFVTLLIFLYDVVA